MLSANLNLSQVWLNKRETDREKEWKAARKDIFYLTDDVW